MVEMLGHGFLAKGMVSRYIGYTAGAMLYEETENDLSCGVGQGPEEISGNKIPHQPSSK
jgi:hypothetical protein